MTQEMFEGADVPLEAQITCVKRELRMRGELYPKWVDRKKMTNRQAGNELRAMGAVLQTLEAVQKLVEPGDHYDLGGDISLQRVREFFKLGRWEAPPRDVPHGTPHE